MSGITGAQYMKRKAGFVVYQKIEQGKPTCVVERSGKIVSQQEDDVWGSGCMVVFKLLLAACYAAFGSLRKYPSPPAFKFLSKFNVTDLVNAFDFEDFERNILPTLEGKTNFDGVVRDWQLIVKNNMREGGIADMLEIYDWIVRLRVLLRQQKGKGKYNIPAGVLTDMQQLGNIQAVEYAVVTNHGLLPAFKSVHPNGEVVAYEGGSIFISDPAKNLVNEYGYGTPAIPDVMTKEPVPEEGEWGKADEDGQTQETASGDLISKVATLLRRPRQKMTRAENGFLEDGGHPELIDLRRGGLGKNALRGLRNVAKEGLLEDCIQRVATYLAEKQPGVPYEHILDFAAGRVAAMQGDYRVCPRKDDTGKISWYLEIKNFNVG